MPDVSYNPLFSCFFAANRRLEEWRGMGRECIGGDVPLNVTGFGNRDNQICVQPFTERLQEKTYKGCIWKYFGN